MSSSGRTDHDAAPECPGDDRGVRRPAAPPVHREAGTEGGTGLREPEAICEKHLQGRCAIEVIDLAADPQIAVQDQIVAVPILVPDLSNTELVLAGFGLWQASG